MRREEFEHVIRAAAEVVDDELVVVGSQAILGAHQDAPEPLLVFWCLEPHDLVLSKLAAGRPQDRVFALEAIRGRLVEAEQLRLGLELMPTSHRDATGKRLAGVLAEAARTSGRRSGGRASP